MSLLTGLILAAHGSRRAESNEEIRQFAQGLAMQMPEVNYVAPAFLELTSPGIAEAIHSAAEAGCGEVIVVPYFLAAGRHVFADLPQIIDKCRKEHPDVQIRVTPHLGESPALQQAVLALL